MTPAVPSFFLHHVLRLVLVGVVEAGPRLPLLCSAVTVRAQANFLAFFDCLLIYSLPKNNCSYYCT